MSKQISKIHQHCQRLWLLAFHSPQTLRFPSSKETERAKFTLYDAVRKHRKSGHGPADLMEAITNCEVCLAKDKLSLTVQNRSENKFYGNMLEQLEEAVGGEGEAEPISGTPDLDLEESLERLKGKMQDAGLKIDPPVNPYYNREEL